MVPRGGRNGSDTGGREAPAAGTVVSDGEGPAAAPGRVPRDAFGGYEVADSTDIHRSLSDGPDRFAQLWADSSDEAEGSPGQPSMLIAQKQLVIRAERV